MYNFLLISSAESTNITDLYDQIDYLQCTNLMKNITSTMRKTSLPHWRIGILHLRWSQTTRFGTVWNLTPEHYAGL